MVTCGQHDKCRASCTTPTPGTEVPHSGTGGRHVSEVSKWPTVYELAREFDIDRRTVATRLKRTGLVMRRFGPIR